MESRVDIFNELKALSPLLSGMEKLNVFTVPEGYFDSLPDDILAGLAGDRTTVLNTASPMYAVSDVPAGYFDGLADSILVRIKAQQNESAAAELRNLSPMLYSIQNENVFEVPAGYFEQLADTLVARVQPKQARVVVMHKRSFSFMKYAVAAAFTGMMALGVFKFTTNTTTAPVVPGYVEEGLKPHNVDEELSTIADDDIIKYLQANGENVDAQTVASKTLDEKELPTQADYLLDEKALDKYLDNVNTDELKN